MGIKIQDITSKSAKIASTDLIEIAQVSGATYVSRKVTGAEINELSLDTTPQLGGNLDVNGNKITSASNGNISIEPNGTGAVIIGGNSTQATELRFMEDSDNGTNYVALKANNTLAANTTYTLPTADGTSGQVLKTDGSGNLSWANDNNSGTVTNVSALTLGTTGTDLSSTVANSTTTPVITLNVPTASATNRGALSSTDWTTFNNKVSTGAITGSGLTMATSRLLGRTTASSGAVEEISIGTGLTLSGGTLSSTGGGLTIGTTAITSGTVGRILFEGTGNVLQEDSALFWDNTNKRLGVGATPSTSVRLDVRAQGTLSTDIAFRVRNSADSANLFTIQGDGDITLFRPTSIFSAPMKIFGPGGSTIAQFQHETFGSIALGLGATFDFQTYGNVAIGQGANTTGGGGAVSIGLNNRAGSSETISIGYTSKCIGAYAIKIGSHAGASSFGGTNSIHLGRTTSGNDVSPDNVFMTYFNSQSSSTLTRSNGSFGLLGQQAYILQNGTGIYGTDTFMGNGGNTLVVMNHTAVPSTNITNAFQLYSNDITAGNAAPHFRTEAGDIIKLYKETTAVTAATLVSGLGTPLTDTDTFDGYTLKQIVKALRNQGLLA